MCNACLHSEGLSHVGLWRRAAVLQSWHKSEAAMVTCGPQEGLLNMGPRSS